MFIPIGCMFNANSEEKSVVFEYLMDDTTTISDNEELLDTISNKEKLKLKEEEYIARHKNIDEQLKHLEHQQLLLDSLLNKKDTIK